MSYGDKKRPDRDDTLPRAGLGRIQPEKFAGMSNFKAAGGPKRVALFRKWAIARQNARGAPKNACCHPNRAETARDGT